MRFLYTEFLLPIKHYFLTLKENEATFDLVFPLAFGVIGLLLGIFFKINIDQSNAIDFIKSLVTLLSILVGFSITSLTIIATATKLTDTLMNVKTKRKIGYKEINLYQMMNITFIFALFSEMFTLILNLAVVLSISFSINFLIVHINSIILIDIVLISHIFLINIRNITNFYFVFQKASSN